MIGKIEWTSLNENGNVFLYLIKVSYIRVFFNQEYTNYEVRAIWFHRFVTVLVYLPLFSIKSPQS